METLDIVKHLSSRNSENETLDVVKYRNGDTGCRKNEEWIHWSSWYVEIETQDIVKYQND